MGIWVKNRISGGTISRKTSTTHFNMEALHLLKDLLRENNFMCTVDLKDAYFCVPLHRNYQRFLRFQWKGNIYKFLCPCFGLRFQWKGNIYKFLCPCFGLRFQWKGNIYEFLCLYFVLRIEWKGNIYEFLFQCFGLDR